MGSPDKRVQETNGAFKKVLERVSELERAKKYIFYGVLARKSIRNILLSVKQITEKNYLTPI